MAPLEYTLTTTGRRGRARTRSTAGTTGRVDEGPGPGGDGAGAVADRELQAVLGDQVLRGGFVVADSATTETPRAARPSRERWKALSCAFQRYGHHDPR
jgi:hypothetical protein